MVNNRKGSQKRKFVKMWAEAQAGTIVWRRKEGDAQAESVVRLAGGELITFGDADNKTGSWPTAYSFKYELGGTATTQAVRTDTITWLFATETAEDMTRWIACLRASAEVTQKLALLKDRKQNSASKAADLSAKQSLIQTDLATVLVSETLHKRKRIAEGAIIEPEGAPSGHMHMVHDCVRFPYSHCETIGKRPTMEVRRNV